jgi:hypothetical protein
MRNIHIHTASVLMSDTLKISFFCHFFIIELSVSIRSIDYHLLTYSYED